MAFIGALITIAAAGAFVVAGLQMVSLRSEAGNTIAELFDNAVGIFSFGMAGLTLLAGIAVDRLMTMAKPTDATPARLVPPAGWGEAEASATPPPSA